MNFNSNIIIHHIVRDWWDFKFFFKFQANCYGKMQCITKQPMTMRLVQSISSNNMAKTINNYLKNISTNHFHNNMFVSTKHNSLLKLYSFLHTKSNIKCKYFKSQLKGNSNCKNIFKP